MENGCHYLAGANTARGFVSHFGDILADEARKRVYFIKGGPGLGKSSLMRRLGKAMLEKGEQAEFYPCSGDPDSLDALVLPQRGVALLDGTAPHVCDPAWPGARDTLVSLGDALDERALESDAAQIGHLTREIGKGYTRAYDYLAAAERVARAAAWGTLKPCAVERLAQQLSEQYLPQREGEGRARYLFSRAYTWKGEISYLHTLPRKVTVALRMPLGVSSDPLLRALLRLATLKGQYVVALLHPLTSERLCGLYVPDAELLFTEEPVNDATAEYGPTAIYTGAPADECEGSYDRNAFALLTQRAMEQLRRCKRLHDELEGIYTPRMDFSHWEKTAQRLLSELTRLCSGGA